MCTDGLCTSKSRAICHELGQTFPNAVGNLKAIPVVQCPCHSGGILCAIVLVCVSALEMPNEIPHGQTILAGAFPGMDGKIAQAVSRRPLIVSHGFNHSSADVRFVVYKMVLR